MRRYGDAWTAAPYTAVVLAGGRAARLGGQAKPQLEVGGRTMLAAVLAAVADADRRGSSSARRSRCPPDVLLVRERAARAAGRSRRCGPASPRSSTDVVALLAGDLPVPHRSAGRRSCGQRLTGDGVLVVDDGGRDQYLLGVWRTAALRAAVAGASGPTSLRRVLAPLAVAGCARRCEPGRPPPWLDCDTPADLARARRPPATPEPAADRRPRRPRRRLPRRARRRRRPSRRSGHCSRSPRRGVGPAHAHRPRRSPRADRPTPRPPAVRPRRHRRRDRPQPGPRGRRRRGRRWRPRRPGSRVGDGGRRRRGGRRGRRRRLRRGRGPGQRRRPQGHRRPRSPPSCWPTPPSGPGCRTTCWSSSVGVDLVADGATPAGVDEVFVAYLRAKRAAEENLLAREGLRVAVLAAGVADRRSRHRPGHARAVGRARAQCPATTWPQSCAWRCWTSRATAPSSSWSAGRRPWTRPSPARRAGVASALHARS